MKVLKFLFGVAVGMAIGWSIGTLFAPQSGKETQKIARQRVDWIREEARQAAEQRRSELEAQFAALKATRPAGSPHVAA
jgi:gas vesicle protein